MQVSKELIRKCVENDRRAQSELYRECYSILVSIGLRYQSNKEDAEFIVNKAFLKVLSKLESLNDSTPFEPWLRRVMINTAIDEYRAEKRSLDTSHVESEDMFTSSNLDITPDVNIEFTAEDLEAMIQKLPDVSRQVFNLYGIDGYSHDEIADMLEMSAGTSRWHLSNARTKLKEMMKEIKSRKAERA